jgi:hypothetical protein
VRLGHRFPQFFCQHLVELLDVLPTSLQPWISELAFEGTLLSACLQLESLYTLAFEGGISHGGIYSTVTFSKIH